MRTLSETVGLAFTLTLLLLSPVYVHSVNETAFAQSREAPPLFRYIPISPEGEQLSVIPLPAGGPSARRDHTSIEDLVNNDMIVFGGCYFDIEAWTTIEFNDVWRLDLDSYTWSQMWTSAAPPQPRYGHTSIYDPVGHRMLVFGGALDVGVSGDLYELDLSSYTWNLLSTTGEAPSPRWDHCAVYNTRNHSMVIFGGRDLHAAFNDLWILNLSTSECLAWQRIESYGPCERMGQSAIYVPNENSMLVFGGSNYWAEPWPYFHYNDLWEFSFEAQTWTQLSSNGTPPAERANHLACYDGDKECMLVFGGVGDYGIILNDLYQLDLADLEWRRLFPNLARDCHAGIFDESTQELIFFGGEFHSHYYEFADGFRLTKTAAPPVFESGDVNCDGEINVVDVVYLVNYLFAGGSEPCTIR